MKELIAQYGVWGIVVVVLVCYNIVASALVSVIEKVEEFLQPGVKPDPNSSLEKVKAVLLKLSAWAKIIIDWVSGNKEH